MDGDASLRDRVTRQGEEALGRFAQELLENPLVSSALTAAFETRERAMRAQEVAMGALNLPSAGDLERLTRRVRSVSQRLEGIEDGLDRLDDRLGRSADPAQALEARLAHIEALLERLEAERAAPPPPARRAPRSGGAQGRAAGPGTGGTQSTRGAQGKRTAAARARKPSA